MKKFVYRVITFIVTMVFLTHIFVWIYERPQREAYKSGKSIKQIKWNSIKNNPNEYDLIILGSSRGYCAYNPIIIDSLTHLNSYNMCTGSQHIIESLYMLKEILKYQRPKYLVYEVFLPSFCEKPDYYRLFSNAKFMSNNMILNEFLFPRIFDLLLPIIKYKTYLKEDLSKLLKNRNENAKESLGWVKGFRPSSQVNDASTIDNFTPIYTFSNMDVLPTHKIEYYLKEMKELCDQHEIELICMRIPYPPTRLKNSFEDVSHDYFKVFFNSQEIPFYDLNYFSRRTYTDYDFEDYHHMNTQGAKKASIELAEIVNSHTNIKNN